MLNDTGVVRAITSSDFDELLKTDAIVFVDFWATWCAPCMQFSPVYEKVAKAYPGIVFASVDIEKEPSFAEIFSIRSIPHLMVFKEGIAIYSESGSMPESTLKELATQALSVDVSSIRESAEGQPD